MPESLVPSAAVTRKSELSGPQQRLVELISKVNFGRIESLHVRAGQPQFDSPPRVIRTLKVGARNEDRPEAAAKDFVLKAAVIELLDHLRRAGDGVIERIEVAHGLPFLLEIEHRLTA
jgi:hypothetical protein